MTQPPLKVSRKWVAVLCLIAAFGVCVYFAVKAATPPERALAVKGGGKRIDFSLPCFSPSEPVADEEMRGPLRIEGFADGVGISNGVTPSTATTIPIDVKESDPNGPYHAQVEFQGKRLTLDIATSDGPGPPTLRAVTDGVLLAVFADYCGGGFVKVVDANGKGVSGTSVGGHAHTQGCIAPKRGLLVATRFEANLEAKDDVVPGSEVTVFDYRNNKEIGVFRMPNTQFRHFAISRDEQWLYVGFGDGSVRRFNLDSAKPRAKWPKLSVRN